MARFRWLLVPPMLLAVLIDLLLATSGPIVLVAMCVGVGLDIGVELTIRGRPPRYRWHVVGIAAALLTATVMALTGQWSAALAWGLIVTAGAQAAQRGGDYRLLAPTVLIGVVSPIGLRGGGIASFLSLAMVTAMAVSITIGVLVRTQQERVEEARHVVAVEERARMAADLHDLVAHEVTGIVVLAQAAGQTSTDPGSAQAFERISRSGQQALTQIRALVSRTPPEASPGTPNAGGWGLTDVVTRFTETTRAHVDIDLGNTQIPAPVDIALQRVLTELLTNVRRHSDARTVSITLTEQPTGWTLRVANDGVGAGGVGAGNRSGLDRVRQRVAALGGSVHAGIDPSGRWITEVVIPQEIP